MALASAWMLAMMGCTVTHIDTPSWSMNRVSLFQKPEISGVSVDTNGTTRLESYRNGQDLQPVIEAAVGAAVKAAVGQVTP